MTVTLGRQVLEDLRVRGVSNPDEFASLDAAVCDRIVREFDNDPTSPSGGVLTFRLRQAMKAPKRQAALDREAEYGRSIIAFLDREFPDVRRHPAAVTAVIRAHHVHGRKGLTTGEYGPLIEESIRAFTSRFGELESGAEA